MSLSVCCVTGDPGPRVAAVLGAVRPVADEIVVAADARVDEATLRQYAVVADQVHRLRFRFLERHLAWLHAQCSGDWILRLDTDEVPGSDLLGALPELARARDVEQVWLPRRWVYPDPEHWLDELPWSPDYQLRMVRNDGLLRFPGDLHTSAVPVRPARYVEAPLYHLACVVEPEARRRSKALRYEILAPRRRAPGGGPLNETFFLPERSASAPPARTPDPDVALIRDVLGATPRAGDLRTPVGDLPLVDDAVVDRWWAGRTVGDGAYAATITPLESPVRMYAGERREVFVRVVNRGTERWSWDADLAPHFRMSYRWHAPGADAPTSEGERTAFPHAVEPGASAVVPLVVQAPAEAGAHDLVVGVLEEGVRWFDAPARVQAEVVAEPEADAAERPGAAGRTGVARRLPHRRRRLIPRIIHRVWLGDTEMPAELRRFGESWQRLHPEWEMRLWTDDTLPPLKARAAFDRSRDPAERSHIVRYEVLRRFGGVYVGTDVECLRSLEPLLGDVRAFAAWVVPGRMCGAVMGSIPGHPAFERAAEEVGNTAGLGAMPDSTGSLFLTLILRDHPDVTVFSPERFYPYLWHERERRQGPFPDSYAVRHWSQTRAE